MNQIKPISITRTKLLNASRDTIRARGYAATTVDDICAAAGVSKGSFFHYFDSKEKLGIAAAEQFGAMAAGLFANAPYAALSDPRARLLGYVDFRIALLQGDSAQYTCLLGTTVQEIHLSHPLIRAACEAQLADHVAMLARDIDAARPLYAPDADWTAESVGVFMQAVLQGAFIFAKARQSPQSVIDSLAHLRRYLEFILPLPQS